MQITEKKRAVAIENLKKAIEKNSQRKFGVWKCKTCQVEKRATAHQCRQTYCSKECMAKDYAEIMCGQSNPNFRNAGWLTCEVCSLRFHSYNKRGRFCGLTCRDKGNETLRTNAKSTRILNHRRLSY